jgi:hypothetical protein
VRDLSIGSKQVVSSSLVVLLLSIGMLEASGSSVAEDKNSIAQTYSQADVGTKVGQTARFCQDDSGDKGSSARSDRKTALAIYLLL